MKRGWQGPILTGPRMTIQYVAGGQIETRIYTEWDDQYCVPYQWHDQETDIYHGNILDYFSSAPAGYLQPPDEENGEKLGWTHSVGALEWQELGYPPSSVRMRGSIYSPTTSLRSFPLVFFWLWAIEFAIDIDLCPYRKAGQAWVRKGNDICRNTFPRFTDRFPTLGGETGPQLHQEIKDGLTLFHVCLVKRLFTYELNYWFGRQ